MAIGFTPARRSLQASSMDRPKQDIADTILLANKEKFPCPLYDATLDFFDAMDPANEPKPEFHDKNRNTF